MPHSREDGNLVLKPKFHFSFIKKGSRLLPPQSGVAMTMMKIPRNFLNNTPQSSLVRGEVGKSREIFA